MAIRRFLKVFMYGILVLGFIICLVVVMLLLIQRPNIQASADLEKAFEALVQNRTSLAALTNSYAIRVLSAPDASACAGTLARNKENAVGKAKRYPKTGLIQIDGSSTVFVFLDQHDILRDFELGGQ